jgi:hypothetical protein
MESNQAAFIAAEDNHTVLHAVAQLPDNFLILPQFHTDAIPFVQFILTRQTSEYQLKAFLPHIGAFIF